MKEFSVRTRVKFKEGILDPQKEAIESALRRLEQDKVMGLEMERVFLIRIQAEDEAAALGCARELSQNLLANLVMEDFEVEIA